MSSRPARTALVLGVVAPALSLAACGAGGSADGTAAERVLPPLPTWSGDAGGVPADEPAAEPTDDAGADAGAEAATESGAESAAESGAQNDAGGCDHVDTLTLRQQIAQTLFLGVDGSSDAAVEALVQGEEPVGGVFVGGEATTVLTSGVLPEPGGSLSAPLVAVDDEGGRVQRLDDLAGDLPSAAEMAALDTDEVRRLAEERGRALVEAGVSVDFAPVVDLGGGAAGPVIGDRAFGDTAATVVPHAGAFADGLRAAGVLPTLKHFPGHGRASGDSHDGSVTTPPWSELLAEDVQPYRELAADGDVAVMVGHLVVPGLSDDGRPTSLEPAAYEALREEVGVGGLVVTDDLSNMRAVSADHDPLEAALLAVRAGADMALLVGEDDRTALVDGLEEHVAAGRLDADRVRDAATAVLVAKGC